MKTIKIAVVGATAVPIDQLEPFQGELKRLDRDEYERLRENLIKNGFSFTVHIWQHDGHNYIIDGHQRVFALKQMREIEQYIIPDIPVSVVMADSFGEAKRKVLAGVAEYGKYTAKSMAEFAKANDIPYDEIVATFVFPQIKMEKFGELFMDMSKIQAPALPEVAPPEIPEMRSTSDGVRQVNLFFSAEAFAEFMQKTEALSKHYGKENVSDTMLEVVREAANRIQAQ